MKNGYLNRSIGGKTMVDKIVENITNAIINGEIKPGDKLPTETELCESMGVGRNTLREAIKILEAYGVVHIKRAEGTFVNKSYDSKMLYPILYGIILQQDSSKQVIELRKVIEVGILQVASMKLTEEKLEKLEIALKELEDVVYSKNVSAERVFKADVNCHCSIVGITENVMLKGICEYVDQITKSSRILAIEEILELNEVEEFLDLHRNIVGLLIKKNAEKIPYVVEEHYRYWQKIQ